MRHGNGHVLGSASSLERRLFKRVEKHLPFLRRILLVFEVGTGRAKAAERATYWRDARDFAASEITPASRADGANISL